MKRFIFAVLFFASSIALAQSPNPLTCSGYAEQRIFLQSQGYWERSEGKTGTDYGSVTEGTCFPVGATLTGKVNFDVFVTLDENPGQLTLVEMQLFGSSGGLSPTDKTATPMGQKCAGVLPCSFGPFHITVDTSRFKSDGLQEFRLHAEVKEPDGKHLMATTGWQAFLKNGYKVSNYRTQGVNFQEARGWYDGEGYTVGRFLSPMPWAPISGTWNVSVGAIPGSGGRAVAAHLVAIDYCEGCPTEKILSDGAGQLKSGTKLAIDTTALSPGLHTLWIKASAPSPTGSTLSGTEIIPFYVQH